MRLAVLLFTLFTTPCLAGPGGVKSVFLNGVDISSARSQELKNVDVLINEHGDIFLLAPHYQVNEEDTYVPLSKYAQGLGPISHKPPKAVRSPVKKDDGREDKSQEKAKGGKLVKSDPVTKKGTPEKDTTNTEALLEDGTATTESQSGAGGSNNDRAESAEPKDKSNDKTEENATENTAESAAAAP